MTVEPVAPPEPGTEDWGDDLNAYLEYLEQRVAALEAKPEYVYNAYAWKYSNAAPPAGTGELRMNNSDPALATVLDFRKLDDDGADRTPVFQQLDTGATIRVNDWDDAAITHRFEVTGKPIIDADNAQVPVAWESGAGALPTTGAAKINVGFLVPLEL